MTANLPAIVTRVGGALELVASNIEAYTDKRHPLTRQGQIALARIVEDRPALNTEARVSLLVDVLSWHGVNQQTEFMALVDDYDIEIVYLALDYLYEVGERSRGESKDYRSFNDIKHVRTVVELIVRLRNIGLSVNGVESLNAVVYQLGGLELAIDATNDDITEATSS